MKEEILKVLVLNRQIDRKSNFVLNAEYSDLKDLANKIEQAINYTRCCETFTCDVCCTETSNKKDDEDYRYCDSCNEL